MLDWRIAIIGSIRASTCGSSRRRGWTLTRWHAPIATLYLEALDTAEARELLLTGSREGYGGIEFRGHCDPLTVLQTRSPSKPSAQPLG